MRRICAGIAALLLVVGTAAAQEQAAPKTKLNLTTDRPFYQAGEKITFTLSNVGGTDVTVYYDSLTVTQKSVTEAMSLVCMDFLGDRSAPLKPGEKVSWTWNQLSCPVMPRATEEAGSGEALSAVYAGDFEASVSYVQPGNTTGIDPTCTTPVYIVPRAKGRLIARTTKNLYFAEPMVCYVLNARRDKSASFPVAIVVEKMEFAPGTTKPVWQWIATLPTDSLQPVGPNGERSLFKWTLFTNDEELAPPGTYRVVITLQVGSSRVDYIRTFEIMDCPF